MISALFPGGSVANFRRAQDTRGVAGTAVLGDDVIGSTCRAAGSGCYSTHALAFLAHYTDLADRLEALGNGFVGRGLSSHCPQGQYGSRCYQDLFNQVHGTPSSWLVTLAATVSRAGDSITASRAGRNNPDCRRVISKPLQPAVFP